MMRQGHTIHILNPLDLLHLLYNIAKVGRAWEGSTPSDLSILRGLKLRRLDQNQVIPLLKVFQKNETTLFNFHANFHGKTPTHVGTTYE